MLVKYFFCVANQVLWPPLISVFVCFCADSVTSSTLSHLATTFEFKIRLFLDLDYFTMQTILLGLKKKHFIVLPPCYEIDKKDPLSHQICSWNVLSGTHKNAFIHMPQATQLS